MISQPMSISSGVHGDRVMKQLLNPEAHAAAGSAEYRCFRMTKSCLGRLAVVLVSNCEEHRMNWGFIEGNWWQMRGNLLRQWGRLTDPQIDSIAGHRDRLARTIRENYGITSEEAENQIKVFESRRMDFRP